MQCLKWSYAETVNRLLDSCSGFWIYLIGLSTTMEVNCVGAVWALQSSELFDVWSGRAGLKKYLFLSR